MNVGIWKVVEEVMWPQVELGSCASPGWNGGRWGWLYTFAGGTDTVRGSCIPDGAAVNGRDAREVFVP